MEHGFLELLVCPLCESALRQGETDSLQCKGCGCRFAFQRGIPSLLLPQEREAAQRFAQEYFSNRWKEGWRPLSREEARKLPFCNPSGYPPMYWETRRQSYMLLMRVLRREDGVVQGRVVVDLGAGMGWLSNRLVEQGYRTISVDLNLDSTFGLGAIALHFAEVTGIQPLQATLDHVPFRKEALSLVIANASLHYASDVRGCVQRIAASLAPNGIFIILDTPIAKFPRPGVHLGDTLIGEKDLRLALEGAGLLVRVRHPFRGFRWLAFQARRWVRRRPHFTLPLLTAVKANAGS